MLNGLMGGTILTNTDGIVCEDPDAWGSHDRSHPHWRPHVVAEDQESRAEWSQTRQGHAVHDGAHGVLTNAKVEIATRIISPCAALGHEVFRELQSSQARSAQVCRATQHPRHPLSNHVEAFTRGLPRRQSFRTCREARADFRIPVIGQCPINDMPQNRTLLRMLLPVLHQLLLPGFSLLTSSASELLAEMLGDLFGHQKLFIGPPVDLLCCRDL
mmetsp:Transcript_75181/g.141820  ORF Transcript_75181/g.141820 Transcript_75181/m.141820 type:complete len:215 (+) Transcript_75181:701-1345(+)